jgi:3-hydroxyacyl-CoA dehydrogenase
MIFMMAVEQEDEIEHAIKTFQDTMMRVRYSSIPVIVAPHGMTFVVVAEMSLMLTKLLQQQDYEPVRIVDSGYTRWWYQKEMALRASDLFHKNEWN